jgi:hypothetical protein
MHMHSTCTNLCMYMHKQTCTFHLYFIIPASFLIFLSLFFFGATRIRNDEKKITKKCTESEVYMEVLHIIHSATSQEVRTDPNYLNEAKNHDCC